MIKICIKHLLHTHIIVRGEIDFIGLLLRDQHREKVVNKI